MAPRNETYTLPGEVVMALSTGRVEMMNMIIRQVEDEKLTLDRKMQVEMLRLIRDLIEDREEDKQKAAEKQRILNNSLQNIRGAIRRLEENEED